MAAGTTPSTDHPEGARSNYMSDSARVITLTDGVFAIAMTLLALDLKPTVAELAGDSDDHQIAAYLGANVGSYVAFFLAFVLIAQYWVVHHRMMRDLTAHDLGVTWTNMLVLFGITLMPITTFFVGEYSAPLATTLFAGNLFLVSGTLGWLGHQIQAQPLRVAPQGPNQRHRNTVRMVVTLTIPVIVSAAAWLGFQHSSYLFFLYAFQEVPGRLLVRDP